MNFIFKGLTFFSGKLKRTKTSSPTVKENPYVRASEDLKNSAEELRRATQKLQESFRHRQEAMSRLVSIFNTVSENRPRRKDQRAGSSKGRSGQGGPAKNGHLAVGEGELFEIYREACLNFIETDKGYYFKLRNYSDFLSHMYQRHMGNLRYYDHEYSRLQDLGPYRFSPLEAFVANQVIQAVNRTGRETFVREGHQNLYNELCSKLLARSANQ